MKILYSLLLFGLVSALPTPETDETDNKLVSFLNEKLSPLLTAFEKVMETKEMEDILKDEDNMVKHLVIAYFTVESNITRLKDFDRNLSEQLTAEQKELYENLKNTSEARLLIEKLKSYNDFVVNNIPTMAEEVTEAVKNIDENSVIVDDLKKVLPQALLEKRDELEQAAKNLTPTKQFKELINKNDFKEKLYNALILTLFDPAVIRDVETKFTEKLNENQNKLYEALKNTSEAKDLKQVIQEIPNAFTKKER